MPTKEQLKLHTKRPRLDIDKERASRFLDAETRKKRIEAAMGARGYQSMYELAAAASMDPGTLRRAILKPNIQVSTLERIAIALNCSMNYLTERKVGRRG